MIIDIAKQIGAISREVSRQHTESGETVAVSLRRRPGRRLACHYRPRPGTPLVSAAHR